MNVFKAALASKLRLQYNIMQNRISSRNAVFKKALILIEWFDSIVFQNLFNAIPKKMERCNLKLKQPI